MKNSMTFNFKTISFSLTHHTLKRTLNGRTTCILNQLWSPNRSWFQTLWWESWPLDKDRCRRQGSKKRAWSSKHLMMVNKHFRNHQGILFKMQSHFFPKFDVRTKMRLNKVYNNKLFVRIITIQDRIGAWTKNHRDQCMT